MNKNYIILNNSIIDIGGGQLYISSKKKYMEEQGWRVYIYTHTEGNIIIPNLKEFGDLIIPELYIRPLYLLENKRRKILDRLSQNINVTDYNIIESSTIILALWGELLAKKLNCKHINYNYCENIKMRKDLFPFFDFKLERGELAGITPKSIHQFFEGFKDVPIGEETCLIAYHDQQQVAEINYELPLVLTENNRINICLCGRLAKPYMIIAARNFSVFASNHPNLMFNFVVIGGDDYGMENSKIIAGLFIELKNVNCMMMGFMFPIPAKLLSLMQYGISSSGAVRVLSSQGIITLAIDGRDYMPIGIYGITTKNTLYRDIEEIYKYEYYFNEMFIKKSYEKSIVYVAPVAANNYKKLSSHLDFIKKSAHDRSYFLDLGKSPLLLKIFIYFVGVKYYRTLIRIIYIKGINFRRRKVI